MSEKIPVEFEYQGKQYQGFFSAPMGAGGKVWYLNINRFHMGQLIQTKNFGWQFYNSKGLFKELTGFFADVVTAWYE